MTELPARNRGPVGFTEVPAGGGASLPKGKSWIAADTGMSGDLAGSGLGGNDPAAAAQTVPPAQRSCVRSLLGAGPKITVTSFRIVSARPAGNRRATVRFTVRAHAALDGTSVPVLPQGPDSQQWLVTTEKAGHWYVDLASSSGLAFSGACR